MVGEDFNIGAIYVAPTQETEVEVVNWTTPIDAWNASVGGEEG